jgi:2-keto-4-pentenoate hydratase
MTRGAGPWAAAALALMVGALAARGCRLTAPMGWMLLAGRVTRSVPVLAGPSTSHCMTAAMVRVLITGSVP